MKKILAVNPWVYDFAAYNLWLKPLGFLYLLEYLKSTGFDVDYIDCLDAYEADIYGGGKLNAWEIPKPPIYENIQRKYKAYGIPETSFRILIKNKKYDYVLVTSGMTYWYPGVFRAVEIIKEYYPDTPVIMGGIYATLCKEHAKTYSKADKVLSNSELNLLSDILGIRDVIVPEKLYNRVSNYSMYERLDSAAIRTIIGCPFGCAYCASNILNPDIFTRNSSYVLSEIANLNSRGVKNIAFYDDALLFNKDFKYIMREAISRSYGIKFYTPNGLNARFMDKETAELMFKCGFYEPRFGLEFLCDEADEYHEKVNFEEIVNAVEMLKSAGYKNGSYSVYMLIGLPGQDYSVLKEKTGILFNLGVKVRPAEYSPIPQTALYEKYHAGKTLDPLEHNNSYFPLLNKEERNAAQDFKIFVKESNLDFTNPGGS